MYANAQRKYLVSLMRCAEAVHIRMAEDQEEIGALGALGDIGGLGMIGGLGAIGAEEEPNARGSSSSTDMGPIDGRTRGRVEEAGVLDMV